MLGNSARRHMDFKGCPCTYGKPLEMRRNARQNDGMCFLVTPESSVRPMKHACLLRIEEILPKIDVYPAERPQEEIINTRI